MKQRLFFWTACFGLVLIFLNVLSGIMTSPLAYALSRQGNILLKGSPSTPNTTSATAGAKSLTRSFPAAKPGTQKPGTPQVINRGFQIPMKAGSVALSATKATRFLGGDGRLEVLVPAGAITTQDLTQAGGTITLHVIQLAPASGSNAGGQLSLGLYLLQLTDAHGALLTHGLHKPVTLKYHFKKQEASLGLSRTHLILNGTVSDAMTKAQGVIQPAAGTSLTKTLGTRQTQKPALDSKAQTLTVTASIGTPSTSLSWNGDETIASFGKPDPFSTDLSSGGLTSSEPISIPPGPGGLTPPVSLTYSSESVNGQHSYSSAAGWAGEGWNLSLGEITWDEQNVVAGCTPQPTCGSNWQNQWFLNDAYGTGSELIPPNVTASTYYSATWILGMTNPPIRGPIAATSTISASAIQAVLRPCLSPVWKAAIRNQPGSAR